MRFLLHSTTQRTASQGIRKGRAPKKAKEVVTSTSAGATDTNYVQSWGQQCSPNCGCVVRFETRLDPATNKFTSASYNAKSLIVMPTSSSEEEKQSLQPVMTFRNSKPMFKPCSCDSLHKLASQVTEYLPNKDALAVGSSMEFTGTRASPAFRHTVLGKQGLCTADTHCFDVVEEALTAMIKGHMPKARQQITPKEIYTKALSDTSAKQEVDMRKEDFRIDMSSFWKPPRAVSALQMMDVTAKYSPFGFSEKEHPEDRPQYSRKTDSEESATSKFYDWVSYVDELYAERSA